MKLNSNTTPNGKNNTDLKDTLASSLALKSVTEIKGGAV
jgi:hypothetical protein